MSTTTMNIRMEEGLKRDVEDVAQGIGLTPTAVFNVFARQFVARRGFPFDVVEPVPTEREFCEEMNRRYSAMLAGHAAEHELAEA